LGFDNNGLRAIALATLVALAGVSAQAAPVAATDPSPTPAPEITASPTPDATPTPATPTPTPDAATPTPTPASDAATPTPASTATLVVSPQLTTTSTLATISAKPNLGARVVRIALAQLHKRYVRGAMGPRAFDCSGLVRYAYRLAGVSGHLGGGHSARGMLQWARIHGLATRYHPQVGDVVLYGNGTHAAIYIGHGLVISALNPRQGIRITRLHALTVPFTTFIHTHL
jgi:cell wall-associated NlpC family hydrolase